MGSLLSYLVSSYLISSHYSYSVFSLSILFSHSSLTVLFSPLLFFFYSLYSPSILSFLKTYVNIFRSSMPLEDPVPVELVMKSGFRDQFLEISRFTYPKRPLVVMSGTVLAEVRNDLYASSREFLFVSMFVYTDRTLWRFIRQKADYKLFLTSARAAPDITTRGRLGYASLEISKN